MIQDTVVIGGECSLETRIEGDCDLTSMVEGDPDVLVVEGGGQTYPHYSGSYVVTPSASQQVLQTDGKVMDNDVTIQAMPQGSATTPATIITADPTISVSSGGLITATVSKTQQITPTVVEGYVETGTPGNVGVSGSNTEQLSTQGAQTIHPASTDQTIASGKYLTGTQTFKAVTVSGLTADKVLQGNVVKIGDADDDDRIMSVTGTASGGITPTGTKSITANGTSIDVYSYQYADVAVPNSYSASDEGKVVSNGALVAQSSDTVTANDTYDTTLINSLTVNVSGGGGRLPSGFQEVEYLGMSQNCYFVLGTRTYENIGFKTIFLQATRYNGYGPHFLSTTNNYIKFLPRSSGGTMIQFKGGSEKTSSTTIPLNDVATAEFNTDGHGVLTASWSNGSLSATPTAGTTTVGELYLCAYASSPGQSQWNMNGLLYEFKLYNNGELVENFVPCYRLEDNAVGLYDILLGNFYTNQGTGTITKGRDITDASAQALSILLGETE